MEIQQIIDLNELSEFREKHLQAEDIIILIETLNSKQDVNWFRKFMAVRKTLPNELLKPIIISGGKNRDVSKVKFWMPDLIRLYSQEQIDEKIIEIIAESNMVNKCKFVNLFYANGFRKIVRGKTELIVSWKWNGKFHEEEYIVGNLEEMAIRSNNLKIKRYNFLISEFIETNNNVYRYFISIQIPRTTEQFPNQDNKNINTVTQILNDESFPKSALELIELVKGDEELEYLLFNKLNWSKK